MDGFLNSVEQDPTWYQFYILERNDCLVLTPDGKRIPMRLEDARRYIAKYGGRLITN